MGIIGSFLAFIPLFAETGAEHSESGFGLNFDIFEANVINLAIVIGLLIYFGRSLFGKILSERRLQIESAIADAEKRKQEAASALADEQQKLAQAQAEATRIRSQAEERAKAVKHEVMAKAAQDIERLRQSAVQDLTAEQERVAEELRKRAVELALQKVQEQLPGYLDEAAQQKLIDRSIAQVGG